MGIDRLDDRDKKFIENQKRLGSKRDIIITTSVAVICLLLVFYALTKESCNRFLVFISAVAFCINANVLGQIFINRRWLKIVNKLIE